MTSNSESNNNNEAHPSDSQISLEATSNEKLEPLCHWCHQLGEENEQFLQVELVEGDQTKAYYYCSKEHELKIIRFYNYSKNFRIVYYLFILLFPIILLTLLAIFHNWLFIYVVFISLGLGIIILPLLGEKTVNGLGLKNSLILGRVLGLVILLIGVTLFVINGWKIFLPD
ncbi:MAG: hypothetical protein ACTSQK_07205 [Candidatus Heimdallarchaeota archaeon]